MKKDWIEDLLNVAARAGEAIMDVYASGAEVWQKDDKSPLTNADKASHTIIAQALEPMGLPVLSEEGRSIPFEERKKWERYWLVDPLDGTKEFLKRNGEFTVNIALMHNGLPEWGVVYAPAIKMLYWGGSYTGAFCKKADDAPKKIEVSRYTQIKRIVASRSHLSPETETFIQQFPGADLKSIGSSLKIMLVAAGDADIYPRFAPTMEWDTAAAHAILKGAGGRLTQPDGTPFVYNKENLLNPWFLADGK